MNKISKNNKMESLRKNKKWLILSSMAILILVGLFLERKVLIQKLKQPSLSLNNQMISSDIMSIEQYKKDLPELQKKAASNDAVDLQNYAVAQTATGDLSGAESTYRKQINMNGDDILAHNNLANVLRYQGRFDDAILEYRAVIEIAPNSISSYSNLANLYQYFLGKSDEAINIYQEAIDRNGDSVEIYLLLANVYEASGNSESAREYFQKVLDIQPENILATDGLERLK